MILKSENCFSLRMGYGLDFLLWHISCYYMMVYDVQNQNL